MMAREAHTAEKCRIEVVAGVEGPSLYINDCRVAGPKPWGGGRVTQRWICDEKHIRDALAKAKLGE